MPTTTYSLPDFDNLQIITENFVNCSANLATPPDVNFGGGYGGAYTSTPGVPNPSANSVAGTAIYTYNLNHSGALLPIPLAARIIKITVRQQISTLTTSVTFDAQFQDPPPTPILGSATASTVATAFSRPIDSSTVAWITSNNAPNFTKSDPSGSVTTFSLATSINQPTLLETIYDITTNPNGNFPLGYMDYDTFINKFTSFSSGYNVSTANVGIFQFAPSPAGILTGTQSQAINIIAANLVVEVEWQLPTSWTIESSTITLPNNVVTITRPADSVKDGDTEQIEKIQIGNTIIEPNDPWVIIWTTLTIKFHLPTNEKYDPDPEIQLFFVGTEFSGAVSSVPLTIVYADLSGIYQLDDSIHHDVLYERTATPTTQNVLIPAPLFVTHFVDTPETDILHCAGTRIGITGQGTVKQVLQSADYIHTLQFGNTALRTSNNKSPFSLANFIDQHASLRVYMDSLDDFMRVDKVVIFTKPIFTGYPQ